MSHFLDYQPVPEEEAVGRLVHKISAKISSRFPETESDPKSLSATEFAGANDKTIIDSERKWGDTANQEPNKAWNSEKTLGNETKEIDPPSKKYWPPSDEDKRPILFAGFCLLIFLFAVAFYFI